MGTLSASLNIAVQAMLTDQAALSTTSNNIANANTPGYSRQTVDLAEVAPVDYGGLLIGNGVQIQQVVSQQQQSAANSTRSGNPATEQIQCLSRLHAAGANSVQ